MAGAQPLGFLALGIAAVAIAAMLWLWYPIFILTHIDWAQVWKKILDKPFFFAELVLFLLAPLFLVGGHVVHTRQARLTLQTDRHASLCQWAAPAGTLAGLDIGS